MQRTDLTPSSENIPLSLLQRSLTKNVIFAVNYECSMVDRFCMLSKRRRKPSTSVGSLRNSTGNQSINRENSAPNLPHVQDFSKNGTSDEKDSSNQRKTGTTRRSRRELKKREAEVERSRVRYDMELVPPARRNQLFLNRFPCWWTGENQSRLPLRQPNTLENKIFNDCVQNNDKNLSALPFSDDGCVVWIPKKRVEWMDTVSEMTAVCTSASFRRHVATQGQSTATKPFHAPLSADYIRDRVDIDDPLQGYQIRHKKGGWLQGFILWTNFTTWTPYFKWDSLHPRSGMEHALLGKYDSDGSLSSELETLPRSGDPLGGGVVFHKIAEIALVGGLGCGEYLLRMALESICSSNQYEYVVLQATDSSKKFYERFGFVRVGAVCRYLNREVKGAETEIMGYRHWTHPNESEKSLNLHGGPSYMMCLRLHNRCNLIESESDRLNPSFLDEMLALAVDEKPTIEQLGGPATPAPKSVKRRSFLSSPLLTPKLTASGRKRKTFKSPEVGGVQVQCNDRCLNGSTLPLPSAIQMLITTNDSIKSPTFHTKIDRIENKAEISMEAKVLEETSPPLGKKRVGFDEIKAKSEVTDLTKRQMKTPTQNGMKAKQPQKRKKRNQDEGVLATRKRKRVEGQSIQSAKPMTRSGGQVVSKNEKDCGDPSSIKPSNESPATQNSSDSSNVVADDKKSGKEKLLEKDATPYSVGEATSRIESSNEKIQVREKQNNMRNRRGDKLNKPLKEKQPQIKSTKSPKLQFMKQKVRSYPRDRIHFYNKVVRQISGEKSSFYFVLHYDEPKATIRIVPMAAKGVLSGKRQGRPRYQALIDEKELNVRTVSTSGYEIVQAFMVMKTPYVASEAWDIVS